MRDSLRGRPSDRRPNPVGTSERGAEGTEGVEKLHFPGLHPDAAQDGLSSFSFAFGDSDAFVIVDAPDHATVAAVSVAINASGAVQTKTVVLLTPEEIDQAVKKSATYRAPGH